MKKWTNTNPMRRLLSLALSMAMVLSVLPAGALAEEGENTPPSCTCEVACAETVNESCQVCSTEVGQCTAAQQQEPVQQESEQEQKTETCAHGNAPEGCEACASEKKVAQVQAQIDALPEEVTAESKEAAQSALSDVDTAKAELTAEQLAQLDMTQYTALTQKLAALESPAPSATEETTEKTAKVITAWEWDDGYEIVDEESGYVVLPFTSEDFTSQLDDVKGMLPEAILVGEEALTLGNWTYETGEEGTVVTIDSESCPSPGIFTTTLPEGYVLADGTNVLSLTVALAAGLSEDTSSYADSDTLTDVLYYDANGTLKTCPSATIVTNTPDVEGGNTITWGKPGMTTWYAVKNSHLPIGDSADKWTIYVKGDVHLIMMQGSWLCMYGQIEVLKGDSLTVYCDNTSNSGTLQVWGAINHAAIGGSPNSPDSGRTTINGGTVTVSSSYGGAGIGSGEGGSAGDITINGGDIEATANNGGAGIGTGKNGKSATITINNCNKINARSSSGAGIGSGEESSGEGMVTVNIYGGTGIISKSASGAGIGSGKGSQANVTVNIIRGDIYAQTTGQGDPPNHGAAIGGGYNARYTTVNIGGTAKVGASGGKTAPGIGSIDPACSVTITGGTVEAWGGEQAAGIGGAYLRDSCPVTITGGTVTATGGATGAGIGSGCGGNSTTKRYTTGNIKISGGTVTANGGYFAAGIGGGEYNTAGEILISGGTVIAQRDTSKDNDSSIYGGRFDIGDGFIFTNNTPVYARYTLNGSAKLYLQNGYKEPSVQDATRPKINSGYIFNGTPDTYKEIRVYGSQMLNEDFCIEKDKTMTVMSGASLYANSKLYVKGTLTRNGTVNGNIYYPLTLTGCTASGNTSTYGDNNELFGRADATISLTPALEGGYRFDRWAVNPDTVTVSSSSNSFPMPQKATTVEAKGTQVLQITQQPQNQEITYGADATLSVTAKNDSGTTDGISYKWYVDGVVKGTGSSLTLSKLGAGSHSCYCQVSCDGVSMNSNTVTVTVNKAQASVTIDSAPGKTYDGKPVDPPGYTVIRGGGFPKIEYKLQSDPDTAYTETPPMDAGEYTVRATIPDSENYITGYATKDFTISKATDNKWRTEPSVKDFTYGDNVTNPVDYQALYGNDKVKITYKKHGTQDTPSTTVPTDAGVYDVVVSLEETANYPALDPVNLTLTIAKAASSVTKAPEDAKSLYNGGNVQLITEGTAAGGTMHYSLDGENWSENIPTATDWKTYTVYYQVVGDSNHNNIEAQSLTAEIVPFEIQTQPQPVTIDYGNDAEMSVTLGTILSDITYQWYQLTDERDVELTDATESTLTLTKPIAGEYTYVCKITCGEYSATSAEAVVTVNAVSQPLPTTDLPGGMWAEGGEKPLNGNSIDLKSPSSGFLTSYSEAEGTDESKGYPTGMEVYKLVEKDGQLVPDRVEIFTNLLKYEGCSIRITGKPGIRMITSIDENLKKELLQDGYEHYTLEAYGTVAQWSKNLGEQPLTLSTGNPGVAYDASSGKDPIFGRSGGRVQYTNVLVWNELAADKYNEDIVMRPFIKLRKGTQELVIYGGTVSRSIGYVAQQNAKTFPEGSAGYNYVHDIIDRVANLNQSNESTTTAGGNGE